MEVALTRMQLFPLSSEPRKVQHIWDEVSLSDQTLLLLSTVTLSIGQVLRLQTLFSFDGDLHICVVSLVLRLTFS